MNPITTQPPPPPPPRSSFSCDRHPADNFTGFCSTCLCERLTILDQSATATASSSAIKSICTLPSSLPELRRTKSFSASKIEGLGFFAGVFEPQRKSCDVRGRNTLSSLFSIDDDNKFCTTGTVLETNKEQEDEIEEDIVQVDKDGDEIRVSEEEEIRNLSDLENDIVEMETKIDSIVGNLKSMQDHMELDAHSKKTSSSNFWSAASSLSKKLQKWRRKQKKSVAGRNSSYTMSADKPISQQYRETQSEIGDYGFGRRSCDIDPRFSLDAGRVSYDDPRASWDGYMIGRSFPKLPPMVENIPIVKIQRSDMQIPVEEPASSEDHIPGGSTQTREYYLDSSSKRRKSLDRSSSGRKITAPVLTEIDDRKTTTTVSNTKVSPATIDYNRIHSRSKFHSIGCEKELERGSTSNSNSNSNSNSLRDDVSESFDKDTKKSRWWKWKLWGFTNRKAAANGGGEKDGNSGFNRKLDRSNSSISWRNSKKSNSVENNKNEFVFERNQSAKHPQNNGLLRFYLTPLRGSRKSQMGAGTSKSRLSNNNSHSPATNMLRFY